MASFRKASRKKLFLRLGLDGPAGAGKTFSAARAAFTLGNRVAVINTERGAVEKYSGLAPDGVAWDFDVMDLDNFAPTAYTQAILEAARLGYDVLIIDSLSHAWNGVGGALELVSKKGGNSYTAWKDVTPMHNQMIEAILRAPLHIIATIRSKMDYVLETDEKGKQVPRKVGMAPVQRNGMEYEFDVFCDMDLTHTLTVSKTRCPDIDGEIVVKPDATFFAKIARWLNEGTAVDASYYMASEADLQKSIAAREAAEKEAAKGGNGQPAAPQKSALEIMREQKERERIAAAKQGGPDPLHGQSVAAAPAPASSPPQNKEASEAASPAPATEPAASKEAHSSSPAAVEDSAPPVVSSASSAAKAVSSPAKEDQSSPAIANPEPSRSDLLADNGAAGQQIDLNSPATEKQVDQIRFLVKSLKPYCEDQEQRVIAVVKKLGIASGKAKDLTFGQAETIVKSLANKLQAEEAKERLGAAAAKGAAVASAEAGANGSSSPASTTAASPASTTAASVDAPSKN